MGQAWCKERTKKAQDSKSPLDRVFVRCAHQIYPTLKQDGSVLGGATQRVTSSEIGYAGSPPREALTRGQSVDSIDRPFHPSEWVDVNLEVPSTPSSVITNITANTSLHRTTTLSSTGSNLKSTVAPVPPPRNRRKNRGRPLPPKPDEIPETHKNGKLKTIEPLYSSMKSSKVNRNLVSSNRNEGDDEESRKAEEVNDVERTSAITAVTGEDESASRDRKEIRREVAARHRDNDEEKKKNEEEEDAEETEGKGNESGMTNRESEYEKFSKIHAITSSSTPKTSDRESAFRDLVTRPMIGEEEVSDVVAKVANNRSKNYSTVSLPNYDELEVVKKEVAADLEIPINQGRERISSTNSLPGAKPATQLPQGMVKRLEQYMTRSRSFGSLRPHDVIDELKAQGELIGSSDDDDDGWGGLDDWDLGVIEYQEPGDGRSPLEPSSRLKERKTTVKGDAVSPKKTTADRVEVVVNKSEEDDLSREKDKPMKNKSELSVSGEKLSVVTSIPRNASFEIPKSPNSLKSALKVDAKRKFSVPAKLWSDNSGNPLDDWFFAQERSVRFFDAPKVDEEFSNTPGHRPATPKHESNNLETEYDTRSYPFNGMPTGPLDIDTFFAPSEDFGGTMNSEEEFAKRGKNFTRSLSNESEPFDGYEEKELTKNEVVSSVIELPKTISADEGIAKPVRGSGEEFVLEKGSGDSNDSSKTPPPSPEPKIRPEIFESESNVANRGNILQKHSREDEGGSNLSSMTPSLTELEAALSDMLEKEDREPDDHVDDSKGSNLTHGEETNDSNEAPIEPKIVAEKLDGNVKDDEEMEEKMIIRRGREERKGGGEGKGEAAKISLEEILNDSVGPRLAFEKISSREGGGGEGATTGLALPSRKLSPRRKTGSQITGRMSEEEYGEGEGRKENKENKEEEVKGKTRTRGKNPFEESEDEEEAAEEKEDYNESKREFDTSVTPRAGTHPLNPFDVEPPEKPSRLHRIPLDPQEESDDPEVPRAPQRKYKLGATSPTITKTSPDNIESEFPINDSDPHPNDRLI